MRAALLSIVVLSFLLLVLYACRKDNADYAQTSYPAAIAKIITNKCAISGCHNDASYLNSNGLNLSTWDNLMKGGNGGAALVPFRIDQSPLLLFCNAYSDLGIVSPNIMPPVGPRLSRDEVITLQNWVKQGAPNAAGYVAFSSNPATRHKVYVCNSGCNSNTMTVFDGATGLAMRYMDIGMQPGSVTGYGANPAVHDIGLTPDKQHLLAVFRNSRYLEMYNTTTDELEARIDLVAPLNGQANPYASNPTFDIVTISNDGTKAYTSSFGNGLVAVVDLVNKKLVKYITNIKNAHGLALSPDNTKLYVAAQSGNYVVRVDLTSKFLNASEITLNPTESPADNNELLPHQVIFSPDGTRYFVTCQQTAEVRVMDAGTDTLMYVIKTGSTPQEMAYSNRSPYLFVSCTDDSSKGIPLCRGSVTVINYQTLQSRNIGGDAVHTKSNPYQPHGIDVDDVYNRVYIASENSSVRGPAPHHISACNARNGYVTALDISSGDINTMHWVYTYRPEVSVFPYEISVK